MDGVRAGAAPIPGDRRRVGAHRGQEEIRLRNIRHGVPRVSHGPLVTDEGGRDLGWGVAGAERFLPGRVHRLGKRWEDAPIQCQKPTLRESARSGPARTPASRVRGLPVEVAGGCSYRSEFGPTDALSPKGSGAPIGRAEPLPDVGGR